MDNNFQFRSCPNCGKQVNVTHPSCWSCGMTFYQQPTQPTQQIYFQPQYQQMYYNPNYNQIKTLNIVAMILSLLGLVLSAVSVFLPSFSVSVLGYSESASLFGNSSDAYIILILCAIDIVIIICKCKTYGIDTIVSGGILLFFAVYHIKNMLAKIDELGEYSGFAKIGSGLYLLLIGAMITLIGGIVFCVAHQKSKKG